MQLYSCVTGEPAGPASNAHATLEQHLVIIQAESSFSPAWEGSVLPEKTQSSLRKLGPA